MDELKPCPFCGADRWNLYVVTVEQRGFETVGIFCNACKQTVTLEENEWEGNNETTRAAAIEAWNRRPQDLPAAQFQRLTVEGVTLYRCDPAKNTVCSKTSCFADGGQCYLTKHKDFEKTEEGAE